MNTFKRLAIHLPVSLLVFSILVIPALTFAGTTISNKTPVPAENCLQTTDLSKGIVKCGRKISCEYQITKDAKGNEVENRSIIVRTPDPSNACKFNDVIDLVNNIITFILFKITLPVVVVMFAYAGILFITAGGEAAGARNKAKTIFFDAVIGLVIAFLAYLIIKLILSSLGYNGAWIGF